MMENKQVKTVDALFREGLSEARVQPRPELWDQIQSQVQQREPVQVPVPWGWWMAAAAVGVLFALGIHLAWQPPVATESALAQNQDVPNNLETVAPSPTADQLALTVPFSTPEVENGTPALPPVNQQVAAGGFEPNPAPQNFIPVSPKEDAGTNSEIKRNAHLPVPSTIIAQEAQLPLQDQEARLRTGMSLDFPYEFDEDARAFDLNALAFEDAVNKEGGKSRWKLGGLFSPEMAMNTSNLAIPGASQVREDFAATESVDRETLPSVAQTRSVAFSSGFQLGYTVSEHFEINTGLTYSTRTSGFGQPEAYPYDNDQTSLAAYASEPTSHDYTHTYLEVPVTVRLHLLPDKKLDLFLTSGTSSQLFIENEQRNQYPGFSDAKLESTEVGTLTPYRFNALAGMGVEYAFNDHLSMNVEPLLRKEIYSDPVVSIANPDLSMSLRTGVNYRF